MGKRGPLPKNKLGDAIATAAPVAMKPTKEQIDRERRWRAEDALRDIERAKKHESDKQLMADVKQVAKEKMEDLARVCKK